MLRVLVKKQMTEIFRSYFYDAKKNQKRSKGATIGFILMYVAIMVVVLGGIFAFLSVQLCGPMAEAGMAWMYFALMGLFAIMLGAFGSVFNTFSGLYLSKDNDMLLSMPIPVKYIMASRLLSVYLMGLMYSGVVIIPAVIVYWLTVPISFAAVVGSILLIAIISVIVLVISCALGWVVAKISLKLKNKSFITAIAAVGFMALYYFINFKIQELMRIFLENITSIGEKVMDSAHVLYFFGSVGVGRWLSIIGCTAAVALLFALTWYILSRSFIKIATSSGMTSRVKYKYTASVQSSVSKAMLKKELKRFTSSPSYMLNCGFGVIFLIVIGIMLLVKGGSIAELVQTVFGSVAELVPVFVGAIMCMIIGMNAIAVPSVSLEGRTMWLSHVLPVMPMQVINAKVLVSVLVNGVPALFCSACMMIVFRQTILQAAAAAVAVLSFTVVSALLGMLIGLKMPNLNWTSEIVAVKQNTGILFAMLFSSVYAILLGLGCYLLKDIIHVVPYLLIVIILTSGASYLLYGWLKKKGTEIFASL